ncbi:hypothetical protein Glove_441g10 [Diversispora epigaea]|uniref:Uncharacterized protein n=1 Tax=Diversispora epigaea TaxID=1348612 RepID=A0A397GT76_9GLOM|nr:hypothetical protein Glove_441g10 [Diversispora epigaea]
MDILLYLGVLHNADLSSVSPKLAMLDTNKNPFEWSIPSNSEENSPPSTYGHTANLYNDFMIIIFGKIKTIDQSEQNPDILEIPGSNQN